MSGNNRKIQPDGRLSNVVEDIDTNNARYLTEQKKREMLRNNNSMDMSSMGDVTLAHNQSIAFQGSDGRSLDIGTVDQEDEDDEKSNSEEGKCNRSPLTPL